MVTVTMKIRDFKEGCEVRESITLELTCELRENAASRGQNTLGKENKCKGPAGVLSRRGVPGQQKGQCSQSLLNKVGTLRKCGPEVDRALG